MKKQIQNEQRFCTKQQVRHRTGVNEYKWQYINNNGLKYIVYIIYHTKSNNERTVLNARVCVEAIQCFGHVARRSARLSWKALWRARSLKVIGWIKQWTYMQLKKMAEDRTLGDATQGTSHQLPPTLKDDGTVCMSCLTIFESQSDAECSQCSVKARNCIIDRHMHLRSRIPAVSRGCSAM